MNGLCYGIKRIDVIQVLTTGHQWLQVNKAETAAYSHGQAVPDTRGEIFEQLFPAP